MSDMSNDVNQEHLLWVPSYLLTTLPSILRFHGERRLPGMGRVEGARAPRWWALMRLVLAMRGIASCKP